MPIPEIWRKSSYSGGGDGNNCVEIAARPTHIAIRDSKAPAGAVLAFPAGAFAAFLDGVKGYSTVTDFARLRGRSKVEAVSLEPERSRDFIGRLAKEL